VGSYTGADGSTHDMADVWFAKQTGDAPTAADLLASPAPDLLGATGTAPPAAAVSAAPDLWATQLMVPPGAAIRQAADDELLRSQAPLL
jgi:hypothetical protein